MSDDYFYSTDQSIKRLNKPNQFKLKKTTISTSFLLNAWLGTVLFSSEYYFAQNREFSWATEAADLEQIRIFAAASRHVT